MKFVSFVSVKRALLMAIILNSLFLTSCLFDVKLSNGTPEKPKVKPDFYTRLGVIENMVPKLGEVYVYGDTVVSGMWLRDLVSDGLLIVEIDKSDDEDHVETLITHLRKSAREGRLQMKTVVVAGGYHTGAARAIREELNIPFAVYTTEKKLRNYNFIGPKLIYVSESMRADTRIIFRGQRVELLSEFIASASVKHLKFQQ